MPQSSLIFFFAVINVAGFILYTLRFLLLRHRDNTVFDVIIAIVAFLGGSAGIIFSFLIFDRRFEKGNMMMCVLISCLVVIQVIVFLIFTGHLKNDISFDFFLYIRQHRNLLIYIIAVNIITFAAFGLDKLSAVKGLRRTRILTFLLLSFAGGSVGALSGMYVFRHKTRVNYFTVGVPIMMIMQILVLFFFMNRC